MDLLEDHGPEDRRAARAVHGLKVAHERIENVVGQALHAHALLCVAAVRSGPEFGRLGEELRDDCTVKTNGERQEGMLGRGVPDLVGAGKVERHDGRHSRAVDDGAPADEAFLLAAEHQHHHRMMEALAVLLRPVESGEGKAGHRVFDAALFRQGLKDEISKAFEHLDGFSYGTWSMDACPILYLSCRGAASVPPARSSR